MKSNNNTRRKTITGDWEAELSKNILEEKKNRNGTSTTVEDQPSKHPTKAQDPIVEDAGIGDEPLQVSPSNEANVAIRVEQEKSENYLRRLQYLQADFENYRKRMEREMGDVRRYGNERLLADLLVVNDELELAYSKARENKQNPVLVEGVGMVLKRLQGLLTKEGVEKIRGKGSMFNPEYHEAALRVVSDKAEEGSVVDEIRPGYMLKGRVLRPSIVKVAEKGKAGESESLKEREHEEKE